MNHKDKLTILSMRGKGLTYGKIADKLDMPLNTVKSICRRETEKKKRCRNCRRPLTQKSEGRPRAFCCAECRIQWWREHSDQVERKAYYRLICAGCGCQFESYGHKERKYCSHKCYIDHRFPIRPKDDKT